MEKTKKKIEKNSVDLRPSKARSLGAVAAVIAVLAAGLTAVIMLLAYPYWYQGRVYPGVMVGSAKVGNSSALEVRAVIQSVMDEQSKTGIVISGFGTSVTMHPTVSALRDLDLTYDLITYDVDRTAEEVMLAGRERGDSLISRSIAAIGFRLVPLQVPLYFSLDEERVKEFLREEFDIHGRASQDAALLWSAGGVFNVQSERIGEEIDMEQVLASLRAAIRQGSSGPVMIEAVSSMPHITSEDVRSVLEEAQRAIARTPVEVFIDRASLPAAYPLKTVEDKGLPEEDVWKKAVDSSLMGSWLTVYKEDGTPRLGFLESEVSAFLATFHEAFDIRAQDAKFSVQDGKVAEFQSSRDGFLVDDEASRRSFEYYFLREGLQAVPLVIGIDRSAVQTSDVNSLGIGELLGTGTSNFAGSPKNRRHNIDVGIKSVNGTLISPGDEFSLLKTLGEVDGAHGYLTELVIKGNRTIPEYGGGLCQIGTTAFRAALKAGMPITERRNHSYRVQYYEPAGTDATIYSPSPDFRFMNDTGSYLLFQARAEGDTAIFELWGTSDGRRATTTPPVIYNIVKPPPTKYIKTTELPVGEKKCTERPHNGADASFSYRVEYPQGEVKEQEFKSHYRPWQEVCLLGATEEEVKAETDPQPPGAPSPENSPGAEGAPSGIPANQ